MTYYDDEEDYGDVAPEISGKGIRLEFDESVLASIARTASVTLNGKLKSLAEAMVREHIDRIIDNAWQEKIAALAEDAVNEYLTKPRQKTNIYGEPVSGGAITLSEKIPEAVKAYMEESVDREGNRKSGYYGDKSTKRIDWIVGQYVRNELNTETQKAALSVTEKARQVVQQHVARFISEQMVPAIELNPKR